MAQLSSRSGRPLTKERNQASPPMRIGSNISFVNTLLTD